MRVFQVVTLADSGGAYGGPLSVALQQAQGLSGRGHEVRVLAGTIESDPDSVMKHPNLETILVRRVIPGFQFSGLFGREIHRELKQAVGWADVIHVHLARDLIPLDAARRARSVEVPYVVQTHGMVTPDGRLAARFVDRMAVAPALRGASAVLTLTDREDNDVVAVGGSQIATSRLTNAAPSTSLGEKAYPEVATEVLFLSRLAPRKRVLAFAEVAGLLGGEFPSVRFTVVGPDGGDLLALRSYIERNNLGQQLRYEGSIDHGSVQARLQRADVYVLPSVEEPFPMTVLEALSVGTPTVLTTSCGIARELSDRRSAMVAAPSVADIAENVRRLLVDSELRESIGRSGLSTARSVFGEDHLINQLEEIYLKAID